VFAYYTKSLHLFYAIVHLISTPNQGGGRAEEEPQMRVFFAMLLMLLMTAAGARADSINLPDGTYTTNWGNGCGELTVNGTKMAYRVVSPCGGKKSTYKAKRVKKSGKKIFIDTALYEDIAIRNDGSLAGKWTYGKWSGRIVFRPKK